MDIYSRLMPSLEFATHEIAGDDFSSDVHDRILSDLNALRQRFISRKAIISVVGEFSSGKSSFLNALLDMDFLDVGELPDTTLVAAVIDYSPVPTFQVVRKDGVGDVEVHDIAGIRRRLKDFGMPDTEAYIGKTDERESLSRLEKAFEEARKLTADIVQFNIGVPSDFLAKGFTLIDTPGLSSSNKRCAGIARYHMENSDCSIIVAEATRGVLMESLRYWLADFIGQRLRHSIVVFTRFDLTTRSRRDKLRKYLEVTTRNHFGLSAEQMPVYMMVPPTISATRNGSRFGEEHDEMLRLTQQSLQSIERVVLERQETVIGASLNLLFDRLYNNLSNRVNRELNLGMAQMQALRKSRSVSLTGFIDKQIVVRSRNLNIHKNEILRELEENVDANLSDLRKKCDEEVFVKPISSRELRKYLKTGLNTTIKNSIPSLIALAESARESFLIQHDNELYHFYSALQYEFERLEILPMDISSRLETGRDDISLNQSGTTSLANDVSSQIKEDNKEILGAVIGGVVGSFLSFGLGAAIGAGIGALLFSGGGKNGIQGARERIKPQYERLMKTTLADIRRGVLNRFTMSANDSIAAFEAHIRTYDRLYKDSIDRLIAERNLKEREIAREIALLKNKLVEINQHRKNIEDICKMN